MATAVTCTVSTLKAWRGAKLLAHTQLAATLITRCIRIRYNWNSRHLKATQSFRGRLCSQWWTFTRAREKALEILLHWTTVSSLQSISTIVTLKILPLSRAKGIIIRKRAGYATLISPRRTTSSRSNQTSVVERVILSARREFLRRTS